MPKPYLRPSAGAEKITVNIFLFLWRIGREIGIFTMKTPLPQGSKVHNM